MTKQGQPDVHCDTEYSLIRNAFDLLSRTSIVSYENLPSHVTTQ